VLASTVLSFSLSISQTNTHSLTFSLYTSITEHTIVTTRTEVVVFHFINSLLHNLIFEKGSTGLADSLQQQ